MFLLMLMVPSAHKLGIIPFTKSCIVPILFTFPLYAQHYPGPLVMLMHILTSFHLICKGQFPWYLLTSTFFPTPPSYRTHSRMNCTPHLCPYGHLSLTFVIMHIPSCFNWLLVYLPLYWVVSFMRTETSSYHLTITLLGHKQVAEM